MPIPDYQTLMQPFLSILSDGKDRHMRQIGALLANRYKLTEHELEERIPSGLATVFDNRVGWARTYMKKAGLIEPTARGVYRITDRGKAALNSNASRIDVGYLKRFPEFLEFLKPKNETHSGEEHLQDHSDEQTPLEVLEAAYQRLRRELADEILQTVRLSTPSFFERLVVEVLVAMGYGGSLKDAGKAVGRTGDDGVDGIIKEDRLGLDVVYIQAKRWVAVVGRPDLQAFAGSLEGHRAKKGVFISTSQFSKDAREYVNRIEKRIVLIDGEQLAQLMIDYGVGVVDVGTYHVKKLDRDYFEE